MALLNRQTLKNYFKKGSFPSEVHFAHLIDSVINIVDDGIGRGVDEGFRIAPQGRSRRLLSFFSNAKDRDPSWIVELEERGGEGLVFQENGKGESLLYLQQGGRVGIGTSSPGYTLEVRGTCGMASRTGTFQRGQVPGDGRWHNMISGLDQMQAFEIMAQVSGRPGSGKYALAHGIALSTFGGWLSRNKIRLTSAHYGSFFNKLQFRWSGEVHDFALQVRTRTHYGLDERNGEPYPIHFNLTRLWQPGDGQPAGPGSAF